MTDDAQLSLQAKLEAWLSSEGYPLEYFAAGAFRASGFDVLQGTYVRATVDEKPRELDVVADMRVDVGKRLLRISTIAECKSSKDKPWVVFTSQRGRMAPSACIAQSIGSSLGDALLWMLSGDKAMHRLDVFATPDEPGFGGRQALSKGNDLFYSSMSAVTSACVALTEEADRGSDKLGKFLPRYGLICLPVVVIDGRLFRARYDDQPDRMVTDEVQQIRCHWSGAAAWSLHATVDIVTRDGLSSFAQQRAHDVRKVLAALKLAYERLEPAYMQRDWEALGLKKQPTGRGGLPAIMSKILGR